MKFEDIQKEILSCSSKGDLSDGYHTYNELYYHRMVLFSIICNQNPDLAWKSKTSSDGESLGDYFLVGMKTPQGQFNYHYQMQYWDQFKVPELDKAPEYDGHTPKDIVRLYSILK
jgi:gp128